MITIVEGDIMTTEGDIIERKTMITMNSKTISILFLAIILFLTFDVINKFTIIDFAYLIFIIGCFIRFIYIKTH